MSQKLNHKSLMYSTTVHYFSTGIVRYVVMQKTYDTIAGCTAVSLKMNPWV